jgi:thiamine biosynthesis lipoprotein ApbE
MRISNRAVATSSPCFSGRQWQGRTVSHLVAPGRNRAVTGDISVSVLAGECWLADALTKVVLNAPARAERLLEQHRAEAYILTA